MPTTRFHSEFPGYEILAEIGRSNARILKARNLHTNSLVAIKHFAINTDAETIRRFQREAQIMTEIRDFNVVEVKEVCLEAAYPYIVMDFVEGGDLRGLLKERGHLDVPTTIRLGQQMAQAFKAIHLKGIVHRDIKPENILYRQLSSGELHFLLTDFGIASARIASEKNDEFRTRTGRIMLTEEYASPEQFDKPREVSIPSDYYSLGVVLYECLSGKVPFSLRDNIGMSTFIMQVINSVPLPFQLASSDHLPNSLNQLLFAMLAKNPTDRLSNVDRFELLLSQTNTELLQTKSDLQMASECPSATGGNPAPAKTLIAPFQTNREPEYDNSVRAEYQTALPKSEVIPKNESQLEQISAQKQKRQVSDVKPSQRSHSEASKSHEPIKLKRPNFWRSNAKWMTVLLIICTIAGYWDFSLYPQNQYRKGEEYYKKNNMAEAIPSLTTAAKAGIDKAQILLGNIYRSGKWKEVNYRQAVYWYKEAAQQGNAEAQFFLGVMYHNGWGVSQDYKQAKYWYTLSAKQNHSHAQNNLGGLYLNDGGNVIPNNNTLAAFWVKKSAGLNSPYGLLRLAWMYNHGRGVKRDVNRGELLFKEAYKNFIKEAEQGDEIAQIELSQLYRNSNNIKEAVYWLERAAENGNIEAESILGNIYFLGKEIIKNYKKAFFWLTRSAQKGKADDQFTIGVMYNEGDGVSRNDSESVKWYLKAAKQGHKKAQNNLGFMFEHGLGVERDYTEAAKLYKKSADQGYVLGVYNLGTMYQKGLGIEKDQNQAVRLYQLAAKQGLKDAQQVLLNLNVTW